MKVKGHKSKRGNKVVSVKEHDRKLKYRSVDSSFIDRISENSGGEGYVITIKGVDYPYPFLPNPMVGGLVRGRGKYYNHKIRSNYF